MEVGKERGNRSKGVIEGGIEVRGGRGGTIYEWKDNSVIAVDG